MPVLYNGDPFPTLEVAAVNGGTSCLPDDLGGSFGVVLLYRRLLVPVLQRSARRVLRQVRELDEGWG